jgi:hypothetical protein
MRGSKIMAVGPLSAAAMLGSGTTAVSALGQDGAEHESAHQASHRAAIVLKEALAPSTPTGPVLHAGRGAVGPAPRLCPADPGWAAASGRSRARRSLGQRDARRRQDRDGIAVLPVTW